MLKVKRKDLGFTSSDLGFTCSSFEFVLLFPGSLDVGVVVLSIGLFEKREDNFEKKEDLAAWLIADVSCVVKAVYAFAAWFRGRFCPL